MMMKRILSLACVGLAAAFAAPMLAAAQNAATTPANRPNVDWWMPRHEQNVERLQQGDVGVLFIGDSITQGWEGAGQPVWQESYDPMDAVNLGFSGDRTQHVLWRLNNLPLDRVSPEAAVIMIGTNNIPHQPAEEVAEGVKAVVDLLNQRLPETKILLLGIFPRSDIAPELADRVPAANAILEGFAQEKDNVHYTNINSEFLNEEGTVNQEIFPDLLHPNAEGYQIWASAIEQPLSRLVTHAREAEGHSGTAPKEANATKGFRSLMPGKDLEGWQEIGSEGAWYMEDGILYTREGEGGNKWLATQEQYGDFVLDFDFKTPEGGNSGVFLRAPLEGNPAYEGLEVQLLDDDAAEWKDLKPWQYTGSVYAVQAPSTDASGTAGEWQHMRIRADGPMIEVMLNGEQIIDVKLDEATSQVENHPGMQSRRGHLGFQNHGTQFAFRDIRIKEL